MKYAASQLAANAAHNQGAIMAEPKNTPQRKPQAQTRHQCRNGFHAFGAWVAILLALPTAYRLLKELVDYATTGDISFPHLHLGEDVAFMVVALIVLIAIGGTVWRWIYVPASKKRIAKAAKRNGAL